MNDSIDYTFSELCKRSQTPENNNTTPQNETIEAEENFFLELTLDPTLYGSGEINQVTRKPLTVIRKNSRNEDVVCPILTSGIQIDTALGKASVCSLIWYRGNGKLTNLIDDSLEEWAKREGFQGFYDADIEFSKKFGSDWLEQEMMSIRFKGEWVRDD